MPQTIRRRGKDKNLFEITISLGTMVDPVTGEKKRRQETIQFRGNRTQAKKYYAELLVSVENGTFVKPNTITLSEYLPTWLAAIEGTVTPGTYARYEGIIRNYLTQAALGTMRMQQIRETDIEAYYTTLADQSMSSRLTHHIVLHRIFKRAVRDRIVKFNPTNDLENKPKSVKGTAAASADAKKHCWTAEEALAFLTFVKDGDDIQEAAFYALALDSGARKNELCGLQWNEVHFESHEIDIVQQLRITFVKKGSDPKTWFGPIKNKGQRTLKVSAATMTLLRAHKAHQAEFKMAHRNMYADHGLVFAKELGHLRTREDLLGYPLQSNNLGRRSLDRLCKAAAIRRIKFHGLRHTCATLLLRAGRPIHVVAQRLGHRDVSITTDTYAHVLPDMQQDAATAIGNVIHGIR